MSKFIGNNTITINQATMIEAVKEWLKRTLGDDASAVVKVTSVKQTTTNYSDLFVVEFEGEQRT